MNGADLVPVMELISQQREENREQFAELRNSNQQVAAAVSELAQTMAKVEERHARQDDGIRRIGKHVDDHETRIRVLEDKGRTALGGWKMLGVVCMTVMGIAGIVAQVWH